MKNRDKIKGSMLGGAIGDALGYPIKSIRNIQERQYFQYHGKGIISDNTQMSLFTANALLYDFTKYKIEGTAIPINDAIYLSYLDWLMTQINQENYKKVSWIRDLPELNISRIPNIVCINALKSGLKGTIETPINNNNGCEAITRITPIGLYLNTPAECGIVAANATAITHGNPFCIISSYVLSVLIYILSTTNKNIKDALLEAVSIYNKSNIYDSQINLMFNQLMNKTIYLSEQDISDLEAIRSLGQGWTAEEAFAIAIYSCLKHSTSFMDTILCSVNHDGNSCATGSIAGNIIGAYLGYQQIPKYYVKNLELQDVLLEIANDLSRDIMTQENSINNDEYWLSKYLNINRNVNVKTVYKIHKRRFNSSVSKFGRLIGLVILVFFAIYNFIKYFESPNNLPIQLDDNGITKLLNSNHTKTKIYLLFLILFFVFAIFVLIRDKKKKISYSIYNKTNKIFSNFCIVFFSICVVILLIVIPTIKNNKGVDWTISADTISQKRISRSGKYNHYYVTLYGVQKEISVSSRDYYVYLRENDDVYVVYDQTNNQIKILSPKQYKYVGNKLTDSQQYIYVEPLESNHQYSYYLRNGIVSLIFFIIYLSIIIYKSKK